MQINTPIYLQRTSGIQDPRIEVTGGGSFAFAEISTLGGSDSKGLVQINRGSGNVEIETINVAAGSKLQLTTTLAGSTDSGTSTFKLNTINVGEDARIQASIYKAGNNDCPPATFTGDHLTINLASGAVADFGGFNEEGNAIGKPHDIHFAAGSVTVNVADPSASKFYLPATEGNVTTEADKIKVVISGDANSGDLTADLNAGADVVQLVSKDTSGNVTETKTGTVVEQLANEIYDGGSAVVGEDGTVTNVQTEANPATHGIAEMTALGVQIWRSEINDMNKRLGELRDSSAESNGVWARVYNGKAKYGAQHVTNKYTSFQFGYDRQITDGVWLGGAFSYTDGNNDFRNGDGDSSLFAFTAYGSWLAENGMFLDVTGKVGRMKNSFDIGTTMGLSSASYHTNTVSMSAEAGWRLYPMANAFFVEPQMEVMYGHVFDADYTTSLGVNVNQDSTDTLIGRAGFALGLKCPNNRGNAYVRASVLHDWKGEASSTFTKNGMTRTLSEDLGDTWIEYGIGANFNATKNLHVYADLEATESAKVETSYRFNLGVRYAW